MKRRLLIMSMNVSYRIYVIISGGYGLLSFQFTFSFTKHRGHKQRNSRETKATPELSPFCFHELGDHQLP